MSLESITNGLKFLDHCFNEFSDYANINPLVNGYHQIIKVYAKFLSETHESNESVIESLESLIINWSNTDLDDLTSGVIDFYNQDPKRAVEVKDMIYCLNNNFYFDNLKLELDEEFKASELTILKYTMFNQCITESIMYLKGMEYLGCALNEASRTYLNNDLRKKEVKDELIKAQRFLKETSNNLKNLKECPPIENPLIKT